MCIYNHIVIHFNIIKNDGENQNENESIRIVFILLYIPTRTYLIFSVI